MDKLNLMKAVLTLYISAVAAIFLFRPTVKEFLPAKISGENACIPSLPVRKEKLITQFLLVGNSRFAVKQVNEKCFTLPTDFDENRADEVKILLVKQGRSLWTTLTKKH